MGTPEFAVYSLQAIVKAGYHVVGVITAPDRPAGRGRKIQQSAVKKYALEQQLPVLQPTNLKSDEFLKELKELQPNVQVVVAFRMLPKQVWQLPEFGTFNLHASLLPQYRGAAPINWAIINGETETGVSTFFIDEKIDTGEMILQEKVKIQDNETAGSLHDKLMERGSLLILETLEKIKTDKVSTTPQKESGDLRSAYKLNRDNTKIDWSWPLDQVYNFIRGLSPFPTAWAPIWNDGTESNLKIYLADKEQTQHSYSLGSIIQKEKQVKIALAEGFLILKEIQLPGKRKMAVKDLLNGYEFKQGAKVL